MEGYIELSINHIAGEEVALVATAAQYDKDKHELIKTQLNTTINWNFL